MWTIVKIDKKKINLFKNEMINKLGKDCKFYAPKIKVAAIRNNKKIEKIFFYSGITFFVIIKSLINETRLTNLNQL